MSRAIPHRRLAPRLGLALLIALAAVGTGLAQDDIEREGYFEVRSAATELVDDVHTLNARLQLVLSSEALAALSSGVPLTIELQIEIIRVRRWYLDEGEAQLAVRYELEYRPLSQRYIVRNLNSGEQRSFGTLASALRGLGTIDRMPVIDASLLKADRDYTISMRSTLDIKSLRGPLRLLASLLRFNDWRLASKWHTWALNP